MFVLPRLQDEYANSIVLLSFGVSAMDMISKRQFDAFRNFWDSVRTLLPLGDRVKKRADTSNISKSLGRLGCYCKNG